MKQVPSLIALVVFIPNVPARPARFGDRVPASPRGAGGSCGLPGRGQDPGQAFQVEDPADQMRFLPHPVQPAPPEAREPMPVLPLAKEFLDPLATPLRQPVAEPALPHPHAGVGPALPRVSRA